MLARVRFVEANLTLANLTDANLSGAEFKETKLDTATMTTLESGADEVS